MMFEFLEQRLELRFTLNSKLRSCVFLCLPVASGFFHLILKHSPSAKVDDSKAGCGEGAVRWGEGEMARLHENIAFIR